MLDILLYAALVLCLAGIIFQWRRFRHAGRYFTSPEKTVRPSWSPQLLTGLLNTLLQYRLYRAGQVRWVIHFLLFSGFLYLLIVHGLHSVTADYLFDDYEPTLDPFQFLRNLAGFGVVASCLAFFIRRRINLRVNKDKPLKYKGYFTIVLILLLIGSGFLLEAAKIISEPVFMEMVEEYSDIDEESGLDDLKLYWNENFVVRFNELPESTPVALENGQVLNEEYCISCHSHTGSAFGSIYAARLIYHFGEFLNQHRSDYILYYIHYGLCLVLLVFLPFSRLLHLALIPYASFSGKSDKQLHISGHAAIKGAALYACTNCGYCSEVCSVYPHFMALHNKNVLPHSKIESVKGLVSGDASVDIWQLQEGNHACTLCHNCTDICPSGIDLQTLWSELDNTLRNKGYDGGLSLFNRISLLEWAAKASPLNLISKESRIRKSGIRKSGIEGTGRLLSEMAERPDSFENCIQCTVCTSVCPVVEYDCSRNDYTPQQVMNLLRLGQKHLAQGTRMVHTCLTCYACQEVCPQKIQVTDILLELRNAGCEKADLLKKEYSDEPSE